MFGELEDGALAPNTPATPINYTGCFCFEVQCGVLGPSVVYWVQCGVLGASVVYWGLVWCTGGWCGVLGVQCGPVWCIGAQCSVWGTMETVEFCLQQQHDSNVDCL